MPLKDILLVLGIFTLALFSIGLVCGFSGKSYAPAYIYGSVMDLGGGWWDCDGTGVFPDGCRRDIR